MKLKDIGRLNKCENKVDVYCKKIKHEVFGGHAVMCHCRGCLYFEVLK